MAQKYEDCTFVVKDHIATFTLNRPERRNAFSPGIREGLKSAVEEVRTNDDIRVLVITGNPEGKAFCAGLDVKALADRRDEGSERTLVSYYRENRLRYPYGGAYNHIHELDKPVITAVNGWAVGMGMDLALVGDLIVAGESAKCNVMYTIRGLIPDLGGFWLLPRKVGVQKALELIWTCDAIDGREMERIGLAIKCVPDDQLMTYTYELAAKIAKLPPIAIQLDKRIVYQGLQMSHREAMDYLMPFATWVTEMTKDSKEGFRAAAEKREPVYTGN